MSSQIPFHPLAEVMPLIEGSEYTDLIESVKTLGKILEPITLYEGKILDGRNRYRACLDAGVEPSTVEFDGTDPVAFVCAKNLHRRHLTASQRAFIVAEYATLKQGRPCQENKGAPGAPLTVEQGALLAQVGKRIIKDARAVHANGTAADMAAVKNGKVSAKAMASKIRARSIPGPRITVPPGFDNLRAAVKAVIELERNGTKKDDALKQIKIAAWSYQVGRDIVLLSEIPDLSRSDSRRVERAMQLFESRGQVDKCHDLIRPVVDKVWGHRGQRFKSDKTRTEAFRNSVSFVLTTCNATSEMNIPHLDNTQRDEVLANVAEAGAALRKLHTRLRRA